MAGTCGHKVMSESAYRFRYQNETNIQHIHVHNLLKGSIHLTSGEGDAEITDKLQLIRTTECVV